MTQRIPVHIGLMGHIDHGKTELARALSEKISTAGLDKHPQAKERGITIDLGFTMFQMSEYMITLVDSPGHADLIRSVVAGANIIDAAIVVVAADEGPKVQTGEHLIVLSSFGIETLIVVITKCDLVDANQQKKVEEQMRSILSSLQISDHVFVRVSAKTSMGIDDLKEVIRKKVTPRTRDTKSPFLLPVDHSFPKKGHGTVVTGTILRGSLAIDDTIQTIPLQQSARVKSIQVFGEPRESAKAGDRVGINIPEIKNQDLQRGDYLCKSKSLKIANSIFCEIRLNPLYKERISKKMILNATVGMPTVTSEIIPFALEDGRRIITEQIEPSTFTAALLLSKKIGVEIGMKVLLIRPDLPPNTMRIVGAGNVTEVPNEVFLHRRKVRSGVVSRVREGDVLVEDLAFSKESAARLVKKDVFTLNGIHGIVIGPFGTRGVVAVKFDSPVTLKDEVTFTRLVEEEFTFGH